LGSESEKEKDVGLEKEVNDDRDDAADDGDGGSESGDPSLQCCKYTNSFTLFCLLVPIYSPLITIIHTDFTSCLF